MSFRYEKGFTKVQVDSHESFLVYKSGASSRYFTLVISTNFLHDLHPNYTGRKRKNKSLAYVFFFCGCGCEFACVRAQKNVTVTSECTAAGHPHSQAECAEFLDALLQGGGRSPG